MPLDHPPADHHGDPPPHEQIPPPPDPDDHFDPDADPTDPDDWATYPPTSDPDDTDLPATPVRATGPEEPDQPRPLEPGQRPGEPALRLVPDLLAARNLALDEPLAHERACLGALIVEPRLVRTLPALRERHFGENGLHPHVFRAVLAAEAAGGPGPDVVRGLLEANPDVHVQGPVGVFVLELMQACSSTAEVGYHAQKVAERARLRARAEVARAAMANPGRDDVVAAAVERLELLLLPVDVMSVGGVPDGLVEMGALAREPEETRNWVIPGLLEVADRVIFVAAEGSGKSILQRSTAAAVANGRHPFVPSVPIPAQTTLVVDLENPRGIIKRTTRPIVEHLGHFAPWRQDGAWYWMQPAGIDLRRREDALRLQAVVEFVRPQLICLGPIYKSYIEGANDKAAAAGREVQKVLDDIRVTYGCALWLEAHAPMEQQGRRPMRPMNSQVWTGWPEFGRALEVDHSDKTGRTLKLTKFRGDRDVREWPTHLSRSGTLSGGWWPWSAKWDTEQGMPDWMRAAQLRDPNGMLGGTA